MYDSFHLEGLTLIMFITSLNLLSHHCFQENIGTMTWSARDLQGSFRESTKSQISLTRFYIHRKLCKELTPWQYLEELSLKSAMFVFVFVFCLFSFLFVFVFGFCLCLFKGIGILAIFRRTVTEVCRCCFCLGSPFSLAEIKLPAHKESGRQLLS